MSKFYDFQIERCIAESLFFGIMGLVSIPKHILD
ncbi:hypothetical protein IX307_001613 [Bacteroides pyogenes]|nr:hypothetical protein [Bacteroides pyogenes]MBR8724739.1 hypothetical protein [Bacteroides pyogenes]MBR8738173.1 hypothetical protein [Bacteroides pyogenes]MBR8753844.1 hypothetical protein [Bacteroides pyogenes]MBR8787288.1 hypothetical protein [Bacteroides pyogenes]